MTCTGGYFDLTQKRLSVSHPKVFIAYMKSHATDTHVNSDNNSPSDWDLVPKVGFLPLGLDGSRDER